MFRYLVRSQWAKATIYGIMAPPCVNGPPSKCNNGTSHRGSGGPEQLLPKWLIWWWKLSGLGPGWLQNAAAANCLPIAGFGGSQCYSLPQWAFPTDPLTQNPQLPAHTNTNCNTLTSTVKPALCFCEHPKPNRQIKMHSITSGLLLCYC